MILLYLYLFAHCSLIPVAWRQALWSANSFRWKLFWVCAVPLIPLGAVLYLIVGERGRKAVDLTQDRNALSTSARVFEVFFGQRIDYSALVNSGSRALIVAAVVWEACVIAILLFNLIPVTT